MDPTAAIVAMFLCKADSLDQLQIAKDLREWKFKGGFIPSLSVVEAECRKMGVKFTRKRLLMAILYGCPGA